MANKSCKGTITPRLLSMDAIKILVVFLAGFQVHSLCTNLLLAAGQQNPKPSNNNNDAPPARPMKQRRLAIPLVHLTRSDRSSNHTCSSPHTRWKANRASPLDTSKRIPNTVHQTSKSRCLYGRFYGLATRWSNLTMYSYYLHDDEAVWRLIHRKDGWPEFPHLSHVIQCANSMTAVSDIWRYLILWEYGGIYSDLDSSPNAWTPDYILPDDDAMFVVENFDAPSQYWMAVSPKHPILYYAIHHTLANLLSLKEVGNMDAAIVTGPYALLDAFSWFMADVGVYVTKPVVSGTYQGRYNRSVRIIGQGRSRSSDIITRDAIGPGFRKKLYQFMNMTHFSQWTRNWRISNRSCLSIQYDVTLGPPPGFTAGRIGVDHRRSLEA
jgi:mannosyltransferase OCH1-like enzyme